jgi:hypothetical protein
MQCWLVQQSQPPHALLPHSLLLLLLPRSLEKGTTYNAYLIFGETHTALVDASHEKFGNLFIATLQQELAAAGRSIDYILVSSSCGMLCGQQCLQGAE